MQVASFPGDFPLGPTIPVENDLMMGYCGNANTADK
jgi:hypothetical protein